MRVISGFARGTRLLVPEGDDIRPTSDRVREALFSILGGSLEGVRFLDLFAGTGANGIEALSRGAASVTFVEGSSTAMRVLRENLRRTRMSGAVICHQITLPRALDSLGGTFDILFADPPYAYTGYAELLEELVARGLLADNAWVILEHSQKNAPPDAVASLERFREARYGDTVLSFYALSED